jgi:uncharacterized protein
LVEQVLKLAKFAKVTDKFSVIKEHPADNKFLECAIAAKAHFIVSGDKHLLKIVSYEKIRILFANEFLEILEK